MDGKLFDNLRLIRLQAIQRMRRRLLKQRNAPSRERREVLKQKCRLLLPLRLALVLLLVNHGAKAFINHLSTIRLGGESFFVAPALTSSQTHFQGSTALPPDHAPPVENSVISGKTVTTLLDKAHPMRDMPKEESKNDELAKGEDSNLDFMKDEYHFDYDRFTPDFYEYEHGQKHLIVRGRLKQHVQFWKSIGASDFIIDVIENGYKLPLYSEPKQTFF